LSEYLADDQQIDEAAFTRCACDPSASVVVEACAGSGKTWLLVGRIVRLLLSGVAPGQILAITFTRRAAQEMRTRLVDDLKTLAEADDERIAVFLQERGMTPAEARAATGSARALYERVLNAPVPLTIETFHSWFWQLLAHAPLGSGVPYAPTLLEAADRMRADAWLHFSAQLVREQNAAERSAWESMLDDLGEDGARKLLMQFLNKRAEWWCFADGDESSAVARALAPLRAAGEDDPRGAVRKPDFVATVQALLDQWRLIGKPGVTVAEMITSAQRWLADATSAPAPHFRAASLLVLTQRGTPRDLLRPERIAGKLSNEAQAQRYAEAHARVTERLQQIDAAHRIWRALKLNEAALLCGRLLIGVYQRLKEQQQALDFTDLEWHAHRLLGDADNAAYMQVRLDARYRQILLDEFQDTNALQWQVLQSWLAGYGALEEGQDAADRPGVFVVGDPKQSIYRFRRAEPRVFDAALEVLRRDFGAVHLRTNVTRRNAQAVIDVLNLAMPGGNPLYQPQSTRAQTKGAFVLLPLSASHPAPPVPEDVSALRDVLMQARLERDSDARYREGRTLAEQIAHWVAQLRVQAPGGSRPPRFSDVLLLVRRRTHLAEYERALRDAGVPFVSDRRGGLLATLEAEDLTALLEFLTAPFASLRLAHALRSPIFGASDDDLIMLAQTAGEDWWQRLQALGENVSPVLGRARTLLARWLELAGVLPVHDLLDRVYFEADVRRRYAAVAPPALQAQVQANLDAFIELALQVDSGRYPSLPRFIDELAGLKRHALEDAPDEGAAQAGDAVRVMTIHGAKGLEAEIVLLADAHARTAQEAERVLVVWPPQAPAPEHVSLVARGNDARDSARAGWFDADEAQREQENWNLLYVAATRARQVLVVSGSLPARAEPDDTWYTRLQCAQHLSRSAVAAPSRPRVDAERKVRDFLPAPLPTGVRIAEMQESDAQRLGRAWHALLEKGEADIEKTDVIEAIARSHALTRVQADQAAAAAARVRSRLPQFFGEGARAELELISAEGEILRVDRLAELGDVLWIVDFKWRVTDSERAQYEAQVRRYAELLRAIRTDKPTKTALVTADGDLIEVAD